MCKCNKGYDGDGMPGGCKKEYCKFNTYGDPSINCRALPPNSQCTMNCVRLVLKFFKCIFNVAILERIISYNYK